MKIFNLYGVARSNPYKKIMNLGENVTAAHVVVDFPELDPDWLEDLEIGSTRVEDFLSIDHEYLARLTLVCVGER